MTRRNLPDVNVLIALTDRARQAFLQDEFKIGAEAGLAVVTLGASAEAASSSSHDRTTDPWFQRSAMAARSSLKSDAWRISKPSA